MHNADPRPVSIAILRDGTCLTVSLSDSKSLARTGRVGIDASLLAETRARGTQSLRELGGTIFSRLFPESIRVFLIQSPPRDLCLQMSEDLTAIPWEIAFDGDSFLAEKFRVSRQILSDEEPSSLAPVRLDRDRLRVLVIAGDAGSQPRDAHCEGLFERLGNLDAIDATSARAVDLGRDDALRLIGENDIVHYHGPVCAAAAGDACLWQGSPPVSVHDMAALPNPPLLLVCENSGVADADAFESRGTHAVAMAACRTGMNILVCESGAAGAGGVDFMQEVYQELARGAALGEAVRRARAAGRRNDAGEIIPCLGAVLYGEAAPVVFPRAGRRRQEDSLRQVTTMSYDLVDSTKLLATLGAEKYSELLAGYHERCGEIVARHGGVSDDPQGDDGIMCYFGFPVAREDAATQSLQAGLKIVESVANLGLKVRIGIATGQVAVKAGQPVGVAVHLAARLQSIAEPGTLVVSDSTRRIVKGKFEFQRLDRIPELKGIERPGAIYRVLGGTRRGSTGRFEGAPGLTPFSDRAHEIRLIEEHWTAARDGAVRAVLVSGEAGIGKSRLVREFRRSLSLRGNAAIEFRCASDGVNSAFHPVIEFLRRLLGIKDGDSAESKLDRIDASPLAKIAVDGSAALIAALLSIPSESRYPPLQHSAERRRQLTLDALVAWTRSAAEATPICLIVEDIQWIDPSTRELLNRLVAECAQLPLLVLMTLRAEAGQKWNPGFAVHEIELKGLPPEAARAMVVGACGDSRLPGEIVRMLATRADGVPLFIEESARMAVDLGVGAEAGEFSSAVGFTVPATIQDLLMARLDRLENAKPVAQLGGMIGREFSFALLEAVLAHEHSPIRVHNLKAQLATLVHSGLLIEKGEAPNTSYLFKHALVRDAAYQSLWERDRKRMHRAIAIIGEKLPDLAVSQPELIAHHYTEAGLDAEAIVYWERAARLAASRSAHHEAVSHLSSGLRLVARLPESAERDRIELGMQVMLAGRLIATEGYGADRVERVYARALELCHVVGDEIALRKVLLGLEGYHFMRADFEQAHAIAGRAAALLAGSPDPRRAIQSTWAVANILFHQGELVSAVEHMDRCLGEYEKLQHRPGAVQDPGVMCLCYSAWGKWELGYPDDALRRARKVVGLSETINHKFSMGEACGFCTAVHHFRGENEAARECAERAIEICEEGGFAVWLAHAKLMHGRVVADLGDPGAGIEEMRRAYDMWAATGAVVTRPFYLAMRAEGLALAGRPDEGLALIESAIEIVRRHGERYYEAEIRRLIGELILQSAAMQRRDRSDEAERWFLGALEFARSKRLHSLALRCATSLGRLWQTQGRSSDAVEVLEPTYAWFKEGLKTRDLERAGRLLEELGKEAALG